MTALTTAYSNFLEYEKRPKDKFNEEEWGRIKYELYIAIKATNDVLRYYAMGGNDSGRTAQILLGRETK